MQRTSANNGATMIDARLEKLVTLEEAAQLAPGIRPGKCASVAALRRWAKRGMRGIRLDTIIAGGRRCTSREAVQRFFELLTEAREPEPPKPKRRRDYPSNTNAARVALREEFGL